MKRKGLELLREQDGDGTPVQRHGYYRIKLRMWLHRGEPVRWIRPWGLIADAQLADDGTALVTDVRVDRECLVSGLFYGIQGMRVGGTRVFRIAPHLAYGEQGVAGVVPPNAVLTAELSVVSERTAGQSTG